MTGIRSFNEYYFCGNVCLIQLYKKDGSPKHVAIIDTEDYPKVKDHRWTSNNKGQVYSHTTGSLGRLVMNVTDPSIEVDHKYHDQLDNRKEMLRVCSHPENSRNRRIRKDNTTGHKGINKRRNKWQAEIYVHSKKYSLGTFNTKEEAITAYDNAARERYGKFALTNEMLSTKKR